jgi:prepilin signal peptidase PulO-like enzyme (type II secretory pathway)
VFAAIVMALIGLLAGSAVWLVARRQTLRLPLFASLSGGTSTAWLPFVGRDPVPDDPEVKFPSAMVRHAFTVATAVYFGALGWRLDFSRELLMVALFSVPLLIICLVDFWTRLIHTNVIAVGIVLGLVFALIDGPGQLLRSVGGMLAATAAFILIFLLAIALYRNINVVPFGLGDVYLAAMIGAMVRIDLVARALLLGILLAGVILAALLAARVLSRKQAVAYGPYLCLGALVTLFFR